MSNNSNKENNANRSDVNSGPSSQQRSSKRAAFSLDDAPSFLESDQLTSVHLNDNANDFGLPASDDIDGDPFDMIDSIAVDPLSFITNNNLGDNSAAVAAVAAPSAAGNNNLTNNSVATLAAVAPSAVTNNNSNAAIAVAGSNSNSNAVNINTDIARYQREARKAGAKLLRMDPNDNRPCPMTISLNSTASGEPLELIGAVTAIRPFSPDGTIVAFHSMLASDHLTKPRHFGSVEFPIHEWKHTHSGAKAPEVVFYQRQKTDEMQVFSINDTEIVKPAGWVLEFCDNKILPLSKDDNWQQQQHSKATSLFATNGRKKKLLAISPSRSWIPSILAVGARRVVSGESIIIPYRDGTELKSATVTIEDYTTSHGAIGKVTKLGSKVLPRAYLVLPDPYLDKKSNTLAKKQELSAKFVS